MKKKFDFKYLVLSLVYILCFAFSSLSCLLMTDFRLDRLSNVMNNYNYSTYYDGFVNPMVDIRKENTILYNDLIRNYYYNFTVGECRAMMDGDISLKFIDAPDQYTIDLAVVGQDVFEVQEEISEGKYKIDRNMYYSYFKNEIFAGREYLQARFGSKSFIFLSDIIANQVLEHYSISSYQDLITTQQYSHVEIIKNGEPTGYQLSINNIVYSDERYAVRTTELYGGFGLCFFNNEMAEQGITGLFELELKVDPFGNKMNLKSIHRAGYSIDKTTYSFKVFDKASGKYVDSPRLNEMFVKAMDAPLSAVGILLYCFFIFGFAATALIVKRRYKIKNKKSAKTLMLLPAATFVLFSVIVSFTYNFALFSVGMIALLIMYYFIFWDDLMYLYFNVDNQNIKEEIENESFYSIEI